MLQWRDLVVREAGRGTEGITALQQQLLGSAAEDTNAASSSLDAALFVEGMGSRLISYARLK
eukprot:scaffold10249_cov22-Tisochrysis_lutea.AAC.3